MKFYFKRHKAIFLFTILFSIISSITYVMVAVILQSVLNTALSGILDDFLRIIVFSLLYFVFLGLTMYIYSRLSKTFICRVLQDLRKNAFDDIMSQSIPDFTNVNTADYLSLLNNDIKIIEENYLVPLLTIIQNAVLFIASLIVMLYFDPFITLLVVIASAIMMIVPSLFGKSLQQKQSIYSEKLSELLRKTKDYFSGYEVIKTYQMQDHTEKEFADKNVETTKSKLSVEKLLALNESVSLILAVCVQIVAIFTAGYFIITGRLTAGTMMGLAQVSSNLANPILLILQNVPKITSTVPILGRISKFSNKPVNQKSADPTFRNRIQLDNVSFSYDTNEVLHDVSIIIERNKKYAIIGKSGCGKSTLVKLMCGYYTGYNGKILYDDIDIKCSSSTSLYSLSAIIHQNVFLFDDTIEENIRLYSHYSSNKIKNAIDTSGVSLFIGADKNLHSSVGENGSNLSGGQKQRVAVARAIIQNKPLLVLDEGTSAIDMQTAYDIEKKLLEVDDLTVVTITHALNDELLHNYDQVVFMEDGRIVEVGPYDFILHNDSSFEKYVNFKSQSEASLAE